MLMKIAFVVNSLQTGGAERTVSYLSEAFANLGNEVYIVITSDEVYYELSPKIKICCLNMQKETHKNMVVRVFAKILRCVLQRKTLFKIKPDIVLAIQPANAELIYGVKKKIGFRLYVSERSNPAMVDSKTMRRNMRVMRNADGVIFQTERAKQFYPKYVQDKSCVISNAIGNPYVSEVKSFTKRRNAIVAIGRLHKVKDYETLMKAFRQVYSLHKDYTLEIYGDGVEKDNLVKLANRLNLKDLVKFMGNHKDAIVKAADASCYVLSSKHEGMPNALMEAMAVGLPCVSTDCPNGPAELIQNGINGLLVPVGEPKIMANAILRMIDEKDFAEKCGENAKKIGETHSIEDTVKKYIDFFSGANI